MSGPFAAAVIGPGAPEVAAACTPLLGAGLVVVTSGPAPGGGPALRRARRLAERLRASGLPESAAGQVAWLAVADTGEALLAVRLAGAGAVLAIAGPRGEVAEELLGGCAVVLAVAPEDDEVATLALEEFGIRGGRVAPTGALERAALRAGIPPAPSRRRELREVLGA